MSIYRLSSLALLSLYLGEFHTLLARDWRKVTSEHFEVYTTAGDGAAKRAIEHFERVYGFFSQQLGLTPKAINKVRIVGFSSEREYQPYKPNSVAFAYYLPTADRDYIVMQSLETGLFETATHEFVHLLAKHSGAKLPLWLNEGLADVYSSLRPAANKLQVGQVPASGRGYALSTAKWLPIETLIAVGHDSPEYNEQNRATMFYAQSWALTHMVMLGELYRGNSKQFLDLVLAGKPTDQAFQLVYQKNLKQVLKDLQTYTHESTIPVATFDASFIKKVKDVTPEDAGPADASLTLVHVLNHTRKRAEAQKLLAKLEIDYPTNVEVQEAAGYSLLWDGKEWPALDHFRKAAELGSRNARMYREQAYLLMKQSSAPAREEAKAALRKSLEIEPAYIDARYNLASMLVADRKWGEGYAVLIAIDKVPPERAWWHFRTLALCLIQLKSLDGAKASALRAKQFAKSEVEKTDADQLLAYLNRGATQVELKVETRLAPDDDTDRPTLRRRLVTEGETVIAQQELTKQEATFAALECEAAGPKFHFQLPGGAELLLTADEPDLIKITGKGDGKLDLNCGPQSGSVTVGYLPKPDLARKTVGLLRSLEFK